MTFAAPFFLFAALAGLVPVVIHLIHRQKAKEIRFSTLRFLRLSRAEDPAAQVPRRRAPPGGAGRRAGFDCPGARRARRSRACGRSWAAARDWPLRSWSTTRRAWARPTTAAPGSRRPAARPSRFSLCTARATRSHSSSPAVRPTRLEGRLHHSHEAVRQWLAQAKPSYERADLAARLLQARKLLDQADTAAKEIYVITDNQALAWEGLKAANENDSEANAPKSGEAPVVVVNVRRDPMLNAALQEVRLQSPAPTIGVPVRVSVEVKNASPVPQQKHLELFLDGAREGVSPTLTLPAGGTVRHEFRVIPERGGVHKGEVRLAEDDASPLDNRLFFAVAVDQQVPVAVIKPRRQEIPYAEDSFYLERALAPMGPAPGRCVSSR